MNCFSSQVKNNTTLIYDFFPQLIYLIVDEPIISVGMQIILAEDSAYLYIKFVSRYFFYTERINTKFFFYERSKSFSSLESKTISGISDYAAHVLQSEDKLAGDLKKKQNKLPGCQNKKSYHLQ